MFRLKRRVKNEDFLQDDIPLIGVDTLLALRDSGQRFHLLCALTNDWFESELIEGSDWVPVDRIEDEVPKLYPNRNDLIIIYDSGFDSTEAIEAARILRSLSYRNIVAFPGGLESWKLKRLPVTEM